MPTADELQAHRLYFERLRRKRPPASGHRRTQAMERGVGERERRVGQNVVGRRPPRNGPPQLPSLVLCGLPRRIQRSRRNPPNPAAPVRLLAQLYGHDSPARRPLQQLYLASAPLLQNRRGEAAEFPAAVCAPGRPGRAHVHHRPRAHPSVEVVGR